LKIGDDLRKINMGVEFSLLKGISLPPSKWDKKDAYKHFKSIEKMEEYLYKESERGGFYGFLRDVSCQLKLCYQPNFADKTFGDKNVLLRDQERFLCFRLNSITQEDVEVRVFCGMMGKYNFYRFIELELMDVHGIAFAYYNPQRSEKSQGLVPIHAFHELVNQKIGLLFQIHALSTAFSGVPLALEERLSFGYSVENYVFDMAVTDIGGLFQIEIRIGVMNVLHKTRNIRSLRLLIKFILLCIRLEREGKSKKLTINFHDLGKSIGVIFRDVTFSIIFEDDQLLLKSNSMSFLYLMYRKLKESPLEFVDYMYCFSPIIKERISPSMSTSDSVIFFLRYSTKGPIILKYKDADSFLLLINSFVLHKFKNLRPYGLNYFEINSSEADRFVKVLKELYIKERLICIQEYCKKDRTVDVGECKITASGDNCVFTVYIEKNILMFRFETIKRMNTKDIEIVQNYISNAINYDEYFMNYIYLLESHEKLLAFTNSLTKGP
jgi:hypothetical protein